LKFSFRFSKTTVKVSRVIERRDNSSKGCYAEFYQGVNAD
jgi:hypothetical protein